jgi:hypothetical protein
MEARIKNTHDKKLRKDFELILPKELVNKKIDDNYGKYLSLLNKEIEYDNKIYRNILHVISIGKNVKIKVGKIKIPNK